MEFFVSQFISSLSITSILLMIALGLAIIYGTTGVINMAHGEFVMIGAYTSWFLQTKLGIGLIASIIPIFIITALMGFLIERLIIRHLYNRLLDTILATWGIGVILQQFIRLTVGSELKYLEIPSYMAGSMSLFGQQVSIYRVFIFLFAIAIFILAWFIIFKTKFGMKLRAVTQNKDIASCFGVNSGAVYSATFAFGTGIAALAGAFIAPLKSISPDMGTNYIIDAFMVVVLGGVESLIGTAASSFIIGSTSSFIASFSNDTLAKALVLVIIILILRIKPEGLFTRKIRS
ncbi:MAG: urea ABC transporter permease subunit UrtB [Flavobacteriaceae bacterium]|jgi:urea transport system permease protein|nr:urea ABC transporter permease subunit UrtB [Flavobacteriaceae bacterium]MBT7010137.1 urea ABC transporter permease subunit UrtB [Flavobacteriaceae bacterium]MBT7555266.1 urea ABC transporter permease subunit UrtB [Flavobacteriaceae bacterium]